MYLHFRLEESRSSDKCFVLIFSSTIFCKSFQSTGEKAGWISIVLLLVSELLLQAVLMIIAWFFLRMIAPDQSRLRVMGTICSAHKTISLGAPLIGALVEGLPNESLYFLPLLMWHPMQLVFGSLLTSRFASWLNSEAERLDAAMSGHETDHTTANGDIESNDDDDTTEARPEN